MKNIKPRAKYQSVSLTEDFIDEIKKHIINNPNYKSIADFVREACREKLRKESFLIPPPEFDTISVKKDALDQKLDKIINLLQNKKNDNDSNVRI